MTATPKVSVAAQRSETTRQDESTNTGPYILTLCRLATPIAIPQPRASHLKGLTFFVSQSRSPDGGPQWLLHAGYFTTADSALSYLERLRGLYPTATAHTAPASLLKEHSAGIPTLKPAQASSATPSSSSLTDTQAMQILEQRRAETPVNPAEPTRGHDIPLRQPDDTQTRRAVKQAVLQNAPVSFAVQLLWSVQPIELNKVPSLSIFRAYTLYRAEGHREGRSWYCLRLGFFKDALSAKQVAHFVRSSFASVAVVPVSEQELKRADETRIRTPATVERAPPPQAPAAPIAAPRVTPPKPQPASPPSAAPKSKSNSAKIKRASGRSLEESLEQTLEDLAASEVWKDEGSLTDTGVRHLNVTVSKPKSGRT